PAGVCPPGTRGSAVSARRPAPEGAALGMLMGSVDFDGPTRRGRVPQARRRPGRAVGALGQDPDRKAAAGPGLVSLETGETGVREGGRLRHGPLVPAESYRRSGLYGKHKPDEGRQPAGDVGGVAGPARLSPRRHDSSPEDPASLAPV